MKTVNMFEAKSTLSELVASVESGEQDEIVIARNGKPAARLSAIKPKDTSKRIGVAKGKFIVPDDFDADNELIAELFYGKTLYAKLRKKPVKKK